MTKKLDSVEIERFSPQPNEGLTLLQVNSRIENKLVNKTRIAVGKSIGEIIRTNCFGFFNILLYIIAFLLISAGQYDSLFFLAIVIPNMVIGLYEDIQARRLMTKLRLLSQPKSKVIRDGKEVVIETNDIVLDDIMSLSSEMQVCADGIVKSGTILVNESLLTGESISVEKNPGDFIYSGSFVVSGQCFAQVEKIGKDAYIESLQNKANKFSRSPSVILKSLRKLFRVIGIVVVVIALATLLLHYNLGFFNSFDSFIKNSVGPIAGSMVSMIPCGLYLLTSTALAVTVIKLNKQKAQVQDFYSVEMLARTDVLCVDKTGTITDGTMIVKEIVPFNNVDINEIKQDIANLLHATNDKNSTSKALNNFCNFLSTSDHIVCLPFNSDNKYSAASFRNGKTVIMGAVEFLNILNKDEFKRKASSYSSKGYRVLCVGTINNANFVNQTVEGEVIPSGFIIIEDHVRPDAIRTFNWFKDNGVQIKVISGDSAETCSFVAQEAGIEGAEKYISLEGMNINEVMNLSDDYVVYGRVSPEQKEALVISLKEKGHTVGMTGDGVNDILALKRSDCSIAMASGADAARNVSHIVLMDSNFDHLPKVVGEGRRIVNNIQRTSTLFLGKTTFAVFFSIYFLILGFIDKHTLFPFETNNMYIWEVFAYGLPSFFLALEPNDEQIKGNFLGNIFKKVIPGALLFIIPVLAIYILQNLSIQRTIFLDIPSHNYVTGEGVAKTMCSIILSILGLVYLYKTAHPLSQFRKIVFVLSSTIAVLCLVGFGMYTTITKNPNILHLNFDLLSPLNYLVIGIIVLISSAAYLAGTYIFEIYKGERSYNENK